MDFLKKIKEKANETYKFTKEKTTKISEELKFKNKINENKDKIEQLYIEIGKCVYKEFKTEEKCDVLNEKMEEIANYIRKKIDEIKTAGDKPTTVVNAISPAEELKKMKELLDMDIITQEEFDAKKKQLLGI